MPNLEMLITIATMILATEVSNFLTKEECQKMNGLKNNQAMVEMTKEIMPKFFDAMIEDDEAAQKQIAQQMAEAIRLQLRPKMDERTAKFIGHLLYDLNEGQVTHLCECLMYGTEIPAMDKLFAEWDGKELTEQQVATVGAAL